MLVVDGIWGTLTTTAFQKSLKVTADGILGPITWRAFQTAVGVTVDGIDGPQTYKALQVNVGATVDGLVGPQTVKKLQEHLNAGKPWVKVTIPTEAQLPPLPPVVSRPSEYPAALRSWDVPLAYHVNVNGDAWAPNGRAGGKVTALVVHHTATTGDEEPYFKTRNSRLSCPTGYVRADGGVVGLIPVWLAASSTGAINDFTVALEVQNTTSSPEWRTSDAALESVADYAAWLASLNGKTLTSPDGKHRVAIEFTLDRDHVFGDQESTAKTGVYVRPSACPGPFIMARLDALVARARVILAEKYTPKPAPEPEPEPEPTPDPEPVETVTLTRETFNKIRASLTAALEAIDGIE